MVTAKHLIKEDGLVFAEFPNGEVKEIFTRCEDESPWEMQQKGYLRLYIEGESEEYWIPEDRL